MEQQRPSEETSHGADGETTSGFLVLANQAAGSADPERLFRAIRPLAAHAATEVRLLHEPEDLSHALAELGDRTPVAAGGDGTVHRLVVGLRAICAGDRPIGILPLGTANDLARGLGLPLEPAEAAERIAGGRPRPLTLLEFETSATPAPPSPVVLHAVHLGAGEQGASLAGPMKRVLGRAAYPVATAVAGMTARGLAGLRVVVDGEPLDLEDPPLVVLVANGGGIGGESDVVPGASHADGRLHVVVVPARGRVARLGTAIAAARGRLAGHPGVVGRDGTVVELSDAAGLAVDADGEREHWGAWCRLSATAGGWRVLDR